MTARISVVVADAQPIWRLGVAALLAGQPDLAPVGEAATASEAPHVVRVLAPRVLLLDLDLAGAGSEALVLDLRRAQPGLRVLVVGPLETSTLWPRLGAAGAAGFVLCDEAPEALAVALRAVASGQVWVSSRARQAIAAPEPPQRARSHDLNARERQVLALLACGRTNAEVASALGLSERMVRHYVTRVCSRLGLATRGEAIAWAARQGLDLEAQGRLWA